MVENKDGQLTVNFQPQKLGNKIVVTQILEKDEEPEEEDSGERSLERRQNINDIFDVKCAVMKHFKEMEMADRKIGKLLELIDAYGFYRLDKTYSVTAHGKDWLETTIDQKCWSWMVKLYQLEKYMLCTEYSKLSKQIENFDFPVFNLDNAQVWLEGLKRLVYDSIQKLIEQVFERIVGETYYTGSGYSNREKKKRNNNGIDKHFILTTHDIGTLNYWNHRPTVTDDLEKACYIIGGGMLPERTIKEQMRADKVDEAENEYFRLKVCKNGNTHYWIKADMRAKLNFYGAKRGVFGENIRIKIFEKKP